MINVPSLKVIKRSKRFMFIGPVLTLYPTNVCGREIGVRLTYLVLKCIGELQRVDLLLFNTTYHWLHFWHLIFNRWLLRVSLCTIISYDFLLILPGFTIGHTVNVVLSMTVYGGIGRCGRIFGTGLHLFFNRFLTAVYYVITGSTGGVRAPPGVHTSGIAGFFNVRGTSRHILVERGRETIGQVRPFSYRLRHPTTICGTYEWIGVWYFLHDGHRAQGQVGLAFLDWGVGINRGLCALFLSFCHW